LPLDLLPANFRTALLTLNSGVSIAIDTTYGGSAMLSEFHCTKVVIALSFGGTLTAGETINLDFAIGGTTVDDHALSIGATIPNPFASSFQSNKDIIPRIFWKTMQALDPQMPTWNAELNLGGNKGVILREGVGIALFAHNFGPDLTTGAEIFGQYILFGRWISG